ncbi:MAG: Na+/H+ antiporter NhaC family protein [Emergencia sp.]
MALLIAFLIFTISMVLAVIKGFSMVGALIIGLVAFLMAGRSKGFSFRMMLGESVKSIRSSLVVIEVMLIIGFITAAWRVSGTIIVFVYYGMKIILPPLFLIITFALTCLLSYALGTSFGVAGTVGVIFMTLARSGGVDPVLTAGVVMSGIYFGDRGSPVSSSANMVAGVTGTEIFDNVKLMMKTGLIPFGISAVFYGVMSALNPISHVDADLVSKLEETFSLSPWAFLPALFMLVLPLMKVGVIKAMTVSIVSGVLVAWLVQGVPLGEVFRVCVFGYASPNNDIGAILNGGGLVSMVEIAVILMISSAYSGIFNCTHMLDELQSKIGKACAKTGRFPMMCAMSIISSAVFCNQTIATLICNDLMKKPYFDGGGSSQELAIDMENSVILIACMIPWCIGCSVPLSFLGVGWNAVPYAVYMYLVPVCYIFTKNRFRFNVDN